MDNALQTSIDNLLTEDHDPITDPVASTAPQQATATHWLPSVGNSHAPVQTSETSLLELKVSVYTNLQNLL